MLYFAYASNLDPDQMRERCPSHRVVGLAALHEHQLFFPRYSQGWGGGVASVQPHHGGTVWGIVYDLSEEELQKLDACEGFRSAEDQHKNDYDRQVLTVELTRPDDASVPRRLRVFVYVAHPSNPKPPSRRYLDAILKGAQHHRLPEEYIAKLAKTPVLAEEEAAGT
jgi:gamma-glutamylcyclotransferase (GGCT)/AIG2-like uncharacterized protein YtfP